MDGELRSENLYLASMPEQRSVVAAVVVALYLQIETALEGVVVRKLHENHNDDTIKPGRYGLPRDAPQAHVARAALLDDERHPQI